MKRKFLTRKKYKIKRKGKNTFSKINSKNKTKKCRRKNIKGKYSRYSSGGNKGGNHSNRNLLVNENRFEIILRTNEMERNNIISQIRFLIVIDKLSGKQYIIDADANDRFNLFLFESNNVYAYHIDYNDLEYPVNPFRSIDYIKRQMEIINDNSLDLYEKIDELSDTGLNFSIDLDGEDLNEIKFEYNINISKALIRLNELNRMLQSRCPTLDLKLNYLIQQPGIVSTFYTENLLTLCLYNQNNCISSIMCKLENFPEFGLNDEDYDHERPIPNSFEISSETNPSMQGRKFNKLLRAVLIIISKYITISKQRETILPSINTLPNPFSNGSSSQKVLPPLLSSIPLRVLNDEGIHIEYILSQAINPKSAWLSINYYNAEIVERDFINYIQGVERKQNRKIDKISRILIEDYMKDRRDINTKIQLTDVNINKAMNEFETILNSNDINELIKCNDIEQSWNNRYSHIDNNELSY